MTQASNSDTPFLVADIGSTNARFALAGRGGLGPVQRFPTRDSTDAAELVDRALVALGAPDRLAACCFAVAGPVRNGRGRLTNAPLLFDSAPLAGRLGCPVTLVNDFLALARSLPALSTCRTLGGDPDARGTRAVLGPGTGLGMAGLLRTGDGWQALPSEGGHADLAPGSPLEAELLQWLHREHGHVSWETALSGRGLVRLYHGVCALWGSAPSEQATPEWVTSQGVDAADPACHQTLELFFALLGAAAGNLALTLCAWGGVYVGGGIVPRLADFAAASPLRRRFDERGAQTELVRQVPLQLILDPDPGLLGALECLR